MAAAKGASTIDAALCRAAEKAASFLKSGVPVPSERDYDPETGWPGIHWLPLAPEAIAAAVEKVASFEPSAPVKAAPKPAKVENATTVDGIVSAVVENAFLQALGGFTKGSTASKGKAPHVGDGGAPRGLAPLKGESAMELYKWMTNRELGLPSCSLGRQ